MPEEKPQSDDGIDPLLTLTLALLLLRASGAGCEGPPRGGEIEDYRTTAAAKYAEIYLPTSWV